MLVYSLYCIEAVQKSTPGFLHSVFSTVRSMQSQCGAAPLTIQTETAAEDAPCTE